jgi:ferredoxin-NADP reductase
VVGPLRERAEPVYVVKGSDAEDVARRKFKNKTVKPISSGLRPRTIGGLLAFMPFVFQPNRTFRFRPSNGAGIPFDYLPGQFLTLHIAPGGIPTKRSYTIASTPTWRDRIEITVKREDHGLVSRWLHDELKQGDEVEIEAPNGTFYFTGKDTESVVLIGGGVGITPMMSAARYLIETGWTGIIHFILGFRSPSDFIFQDEIAKLEARNPNLRVTVTMSRPDGAAWNGRNGQIDAALLAAAVPEIASHRAHICGPPAMMDAVKSALIGLGMAEEQIKTEAFGTIKRDPTAKGGPSTAIAGNVFFQASNTSAPVFAGATILDAADEAGIFIDNACRSGTCGSCRVKLAWGSVRMPVEDALTKEDKAGGYILACQAEISGDVVVDA